MSDTITLGMYDASHWTYVAVVMANSLRKSIESNKTINDEIIIPKGIYRSVRDFFRIVSEAIGDDVPRNPVETASNYHICVHALSNANPGLSSDSDFNDVIITYSNIINSIDPVSGDNPGFLRDDIERLAIFFECLVRDGEEAHQSRRHRDCF